MNPFSRTEDFCAIVIGASLLLSVTCLFLFGTAKTIGEEQEVANLQLESAKEIPFLTVEGHDALETLRTTTGEASGLGRLLKKWTGKPSTWSINPWRSMVAEPQEIEAQDIKAHQVELERLRSEAKRLQSVAAAQNYENQALNQQASQGAEAYVAYRDSAPLGKKGHQKWTFLIGLFALLALVFAWAQVRMGGSYRSFILGFLFVFGLAFICQLLGAHERAKELGIGYAAWAILIGLLISNSFGTAKWIKPALQTELYIKTGLVILGAEILFSKILAIGVPGIFVAWIVTPIVLVSTYWFGQRILKISSKTLNITVSADMSVCGVSAAVATAAACRAKKEELTLAIGLSMIFTSVMMIALPVVIRNLGLPEVLGGAWIGGTIDATGAVVAAGAFLGDTALNVAATIKMIQNILIGIIAFGVAIYFTRVEGQMEGVKIGWGEIWKRFPKFILGFIGASLVFSALYVMLGADLGYALVDKGVIGSWSKNIRGWLFCLAFVSIGQSTNFSELKSHFTGGKPLILYVCGQLLNLSLTLLMAYIMFYRIFPHITENI